MVEWLKSEASGATKLVPGIESRIRTLVIERPSSQYLETLGPWAQSSSDFGSRRRARIGYDGDDQEEWRGWS